jgi:transcriptional regulator with XRE-family HTH domain
MSVASVKHLWENEEVVAVGTPRSFGDYVMREREQQGHSARELAKRVGVRPATITRVESGFIATPSPELVLALIDALGLDVITAVRLIKRYRTLCDRILAAGEEDRGSGE